MDSKQARIVYMGTPEISAYVLESLLKNGYQVVALISNEDKDVGLKHQLEMTPTKKVALSYNVPVYQPHRIRLDHEWLKDLKPDLILTFAYGQIVPQEVLDAPKKGCLNLHGSLLPKLRGAAPIQRAIITGEKKTGVTLMQMVAAMDAGLMYDKEEVEIDDLDTYTSLQWKIAKAAEKLILRDLDLYLNDRLPGVPQNEEEVTFADKIKPEEEHLNLELPALDLVHLIHGLSETPGGYLILDEKKLKLFQAKLFDLEENDAIGTLSCFGKKLLFQAKGGRIEILSLQSEGKKKMDAMSFLNGYRDLSGKVCS
ncbi:MAG: methionyl-tRNA formyltransferase [Bacilli bacterium]|nr:methionyl-tRNA formyltransferase [Bacilli bacterium]